MNSFDLHNTAKQADQLGRRMASTLCQSELPHDVQARLRVARQQAVAQALRSTIDSLQPVVQPTLALAGGSPPERPPFWLGLGSVMPIAALLAGLLFLGGFHAQDHLQTLSRIDSALLTDDLPPSAYTDSGFLAFLSEQAVAEEEAAELEEQNDEPNTEPAAPDSPQALAPHDLILSGGHA